MERWNTAQSSARNGHQLVHPQVGQQQASLWISCIQNCCCGGRGVRKDEGAWLAFACAGTRSFLQALPFPPTLTQARKPKVHPRVLESVVVDEALPLDLPLGTKLFLFESEADSEMVILCEGSRAAAKLCLDEYCKDGSEAYDLDDPLVVVVEG